MGVQPTDEDDSVIRKREFDMSGGLDLSSFLNEDAIDEANQAALPEPKEQDDEAKDEAMGDLFDPFATGSHPGEVRRDGTVHLPPEMDSITELASTGEKRLHWGIMISMILVYSIVGWLIGTTMPPIVGLFGLLGLAFIGFVLGERWIPDAGMRMLGITWVIITMKLLYGLAIDLHHWELWGIFPIDATALGGILLSLVALNVWISYHHNEDAIAAQATLVLLAIGSGAGAVYGELGVAGGIVIATLLLHGLAWHRQSGNLASLGIAASNIWIGFHAFSNDWKIGALEIVKFDDLLLLFLLLGGINALNAAMAAKFSKKENWFSDGLSLVGLGRPGLWSVSIGLGMIGALLAISANRADTPYALALIMMLLASFGGSYLVVRGISVQRILTPFGIGLPFLVVLLIIQESGTFTAPFGIDSYEVFTVLSALLTATVLLNNQSLVSDHVLWGGSIVMVILMTILIPSHPSAQGGDGGVLIFIALGVIHLGTGSLALIRKSPSLAGVTILVPWLWVLCITFWATGARTFNAANQSWDLASGVVGWDGWYLTYYLIFVTLLQYPVNRALGESGVNLAARFVGLSEIGARLRDSGMLKLWNLSFILSLIVWVAVTRAGELPGYGLLSGLAVLLAINVFAECRGEHQDNPRTLMILFGITALWLQWRHGLDAAWMVMVVAGLGSLVLFGKNLEVEDILSLLMGFLTAHTVIFTLDQSTSSLLDGELLLEMAQTGWVILTTVILTLALYLPRAGKMEKLLKPAATSAMLLIVTIWAMMVEGMSFIQLSIAGTLFVGSGIWLAAQGELRAELKAVGAREERRGRMERIEQIQHSLDSELTVAKESPPLLEQGAESPTSALSVSTGQEPTPLASQTSSTLTQASKTYHFDSEEAAASAVEGKVSVEALSQAVSIGKVKAVAPELYMQVEKMRKKSKRRGDLSNEELLYGDIHHKPVIVLAFIAGIILFGIYVVWSLGSASAGILVVSGAISLVLIGISRWRASSNELTLPDLLGIETPFAATIAGLTLMHFTGRLAPGASMGNQVDFAVFAIILFLLIGISLTGRKDLVHRIPAAIEWYIATLVIARCAGTVMAGTMPMPILTDPLTPLAGGTTISFTVPWIIVEVVLLVCVIGWDWIEGVRRKNNLPDFHGAAGRGGWVILITILSIGPVAFLAIILGLRRGIQWKQPAAVGINILAIVLASRSLASMYSELIPYITYVMIILGLFTLACLVATIPMRKPAWSTTWSWDAHLLLPLGVLLLTGVSPFLVVSILALSLVIWVTGILQLRRSLRIWGAADLILALVVAALAAQGEINPTSLLLMGIALGVELGIIAWLGQKHEGQMAVD
ncbi:MAG: hypothetical protein QF544_03085 [Candidatus Thalassarchaeaceae archaeon]|nr:hypothetical protein [Candidatus Thalassarchaeaceae archaeon]